MECHRISHVYCLGDMIAIGPDTNEVLEALFARSDVTMVAGNHEDAVMALLEGKQPLSHGREREHHEWIAAQLDRSFIPRLARLPRAINEMHEGKHLLMLHYHLNGRQQFLPIEKAPSADKLDALYRHSAADAVCFGHHHPVHYFQSARRSYVNPGSLGCCDRPLARYAVMRLSEEAIVTELKAVPYDNRDFLASYTKRNVPDGDFILNVFHGNQQIVP